MGDVYFSRRLIIELNQNLGKEISSQADPHNTTCL